MLTMEQLISIYVDEAGDLESIDNPGASKFFVMGCIVTNDSDALEKKILSIEAEVDKNLFLSRHREQIVDDGFHATSNHFDLYNHMISHMYSLNYRSYFVVVDKSSVRHLNLLRNIGSSVGVYDFYLRSLLKDLLLQFKCEKIVITLEQNLSSPTQAHLRNRKVELTNLLNALVSKNLKDAWVTKKIDFTIALAGKENVLLHIVDYMDHVVLRYYLGLSSGHLKPFEKENFLSLSHKIGMVFLYAENKYIQPRKNY